MGRDGADSLSLQGNFATDGYANKTFSVVKTNPVHDVEIGNELFYYIFDGDPVPESGFIDLDDNKPGLGLTITDKYKSDFNIIE